MDYVFSCSELKRVQHH